MTLQHPTEPNPNEPQRHGRMVDFGGARDRGSGYLAYSERSGPSVLVLHEFFGLTPAFKAYCDRLCAEGFTALAPDLYGGPVADDIAGAKALMGSLGEDEVVRKLKAAADHLTSNWHPRLGLIGFSMGTWFAGLLARALPVEATVVYYGIPGDGPGDWSGPLQGHFAEHDEWEPLEDVRKRLISLEDSGVEVDAHVYERTGHWFANSDAPEHFDSSAAEQAWARTVDFLRANLA